MRSIKIFVLLLTLLLSSLPAAWGADTESPAPSELTEILTVEAVVVDESQQEQVAEKLFQQVEETPLEEAPPEAPVWHTQLDDLAQALGDAMERREEQFTLRYCGDEALVQEEDGKQQREALEEIFNYDLLPIAYAHTGEPTRGDYLKWHYASGLGVNIKIQQDTESGLYYHTFTVRTAYYTTARQEQELDAKLAQVCQEIYTDGMSDYERVRAAYDYVTSHVTYTPDYESKNAQGDLLHYSAYGALVQEDAVCQGYSLLLYRLLLEGGVDNRIIAGTNSAGESHSWNIVRVEGLYYNVDATWDAGKIKYGCLLKCDGSFTGHTRSDGTDANGEKDARYDYTSPAFCDAYPMGQWDYYPLSAVTVTEAFSHTKGMTLRWAPVEGAGRYQVLKQSGSTWKPAATTEKCTLTLSDLTVGQEYTLAVVCVDEKGKDISPMTVDRETYALLDTPVLNRVNGGSSGVSVSWNPVPGAAAYRVFWRTGGGAWKAAGDTGAASFTVTGLNRGSAYAFTVRCVSADGRYYTSGYDKKGKTLTYLDTPRLKTVSVGNGGVTLRWTKVSGGEKYRVFYRTEAGGWKKAVDTAATACTLNRLPAGGRYIFTVRCLSADGRSYAGGYDAAGLSTAFLSAPQLTGVGFSGNGVRVNWQKVPDAQRYRVYYRAGSAGWKLAGTTTGEHFVVTGLESGVRYTFTVRCVTGDNRQYTSGYDPVGKALTYLAPPTLTGMKAGENSVTLRWSRISGAAGYRVFYRTPGSKWKIAGDTAALTYTVTGLSGGERYTFTLRCLSANRRSYTSGYDAAGWSVQTK